MNRLQQLLNPPYTVSGTLTFTCAVTDPYYRSFESIEIQTTEPWVEKVVVECKNETPVEVTITFDSAPSEDSVFISGRSIARTVAARLALRYGLFIQAPFLAGQQLRKVTNGQEENTTAGNLPLVISGKEPKRVDPQELPALKAELEALRPSRQDYEELYRVAMQATDSVDRFMSLYRILSLLYRAADGREKQEFVDAFIEKVTAERRTHRRPDKTTVFETIYTRLRNEVGHARKGIDLATTRQEMDSRVHQLAEVVRKAVEEQPE